MELDVLRITDAEGRQVSVACQEERTGATYFLHGLTGRDGQVAQYEGRFDRLLEWALKKGFQVEHHGLTLDLDDRHVSEWTFIKSS